MPSEVQTGSSLKAQFNLLSTELTTRLADGAYVDNTSAAYMVKQIQSEQTIDDSFYLTIFSNSTSTPKSGITMPGVSQTQAFTVTSDIADLFGYSDGKVSDSAIITNTTLGNQLTPSPHVFSLDAWEDVEPLWTYGSGTIDISLYRLSVETVDNQAFGVKAGHSGFVDIYVSRNSGSAPAPYKASNLSAYEQNYEVFRKGISNGGFKYLSESFGVVSNQIQPYEDASSSELISAAVKAAGGNVDVNVKKIPPLRRAQNKSDQLSFRGTDDDDIILHPKTDAVIYGGKGSDLHLMKHADRSSSQKSKISKSIIMDFEEEDKILINRRQFGRKLTFEHAMNRRQKKSFQESEADFVFFDRAAVSGGDQTRTSRLYYNANGAKAGWGDEGGLFVHFHNGYELTLSDLASF